MDPYQFIIQHFGPLEWLLCIEAVVLMAAGFFYRVAKFIAKTDRHDPIVRFYRVFWRAFFSGVTSFRQIELQYAEAAAMSRGFGREIRSLDAPDLGQLQEAAATSTARSEVAQLTQRGESATKTQPIGNRGGDSMAGEAQNAGATLDVIIRPNSGKDAVLGMENGHVIVAVRCEAEDGTANGTVIELLAPRLGIRPYQMSLIRGHYKVLKSFRVAQIDQSVLNMRLQRATED